MNDDEVIDRLLELIHAGEYLDNLYGRPGENLEGATILSVETPAAGMDVDMATARRCYNRGSLEHLAARAAGLLDPLPLLTPAPLAAVEAAEGVLGTPLPPLLRRLYLEVGNGGFGPGYGILGLAGGFRDMSATTH